MVACWMFSYILKYSRYLYEQNFAEVGALILQQCGGLLYPTLKIIRDISQRSNNKRKGL